MQDGDYARGVFDTHMRRAGLSSLRGLSVLELGPGYSLLTAQNALEAGAAAVWLVDASPLADSSKIPNGAKYLTNGLQSLRKLPTSSVDFIFSHAVLEHVRRSEFEPTVRELRRLISAHGVASHVIDYQDHLQSSLNNLRFPERLWESNFMASSGFYTNRLTFAQMLGIFRACGFKVTSTATKRWPALPLKQSSMAAPFKHLPEDELMTMGAEIATVPA